MKVHTIGELREAIGALPDDMPVRMCWDSGFATATPDLEISEDPRTDRDTLWFDGG